MDSCRISWGRVQAIEGPELIVECSALALRDGKIVLGESCIKRVMRQIDGLSFADDARPGDQVSIHWNWACEVLKPDALRRLMRSNARALRMANATM